jgi:mannose/cellobiose epimerase-like protein (N-acyl-D-glucosamine 2-epimerase family)
MPADLDLTPTRFLSESRSVARHWLFTQALPLWWERGADHRDGGFHEKLDPQGRPVGQPVRLRVQARQAFVYARAGQLGWTGPWQEAMRHGIDFMLARYQRPDGSFCSTLDPADTQVDLYDQAFVLLALATAWRSLRDETVWLETAIRLMARLDAEFRVADAPQDTQSAGHGYRAWRTVPHGGFQYQSNPLMHLLEALLAWSDMPRLPAEFSDNARALCQLALSRLVQPGHGGIGEIYTAEWTLADEIFEPGHQFEWAFLLGQAETVLGRLPEAVPAARRLARFGTDFGIDPARDVAVFSMRSDGKTLDNRARLWAQTERLRTTLLMGSQDDAQRAFASLQRFLDVPTAGLWHEWMAEDGSFAEAPSPASSLYHLVTGLQGLLGNSAQLAL